MTSCKVCGKTISDDEIIHCHECDAPLCPDCGSSSLGLCPDCEEVWESEEDVMDDEEW